MESESAVHDVGPREAIGDMTEGVKDRASDLEPHRFPQPHGSHVACDHGVELHSGESEVLGLFYHLLGELSPYALLALVWRDHPPALQT